MTALSRHYLKSSSFRNGSSLPLPLEETPSSPTCLCCHKRSPPLQQTPSLEHLHIDLHSTSRPDTPPPEADAPRALPKDPLVPPTPKSTGKDARGGVAAEDQDEAPLDLGGDGARGDGGLPRPGFEDPVKAFHRPNRAAPYILCRSGTPKVGQEPGEPHRPRPWYIVCQ